MFGLYIASTIVGWAFVGLFLFGGIDTDLDADFDGDLEVTEGGIASAIASAGLSLLSFRSVMFFLAFFGLTGIALNIIDAGAFVTVISAITVGVFAWIFNSFVFRALKVADVSSSLRESDLRGVIGEVALPIDPGHRGRISVEVGDQRRYLTAEPHSAATLKSFNIGDPVVVVELEKGIALVAPIEVLDS